MNYFFSNAGNNSITKIMKSNTHDQQIVDVYKGIYGDRYRYHPAEMENTREYTEKNLGEMGLSLEDLRDRNVMNTGTGIQSVCFQIMGAKTVNHFDISPVPVAGLNELINNDPAYANVTSTQADLCKDRISVPGGIDVIYLNGVVHHFYSPDAGVKNLLSGVNNDGRVFTRVYRSGSIMFFVAECIRRFIDFKQSEICAEVYTDLYGELPLDTGVRNTNLNVQVFSNLWDNAFVPTLFLFDPYKVDKFFEANGYRNLLPRDLPEYDHDNLDKGTSLTSLIYQKVEGGRGDEIVGEFPGHINQLDDIAYKEDHINKTIAMLKDALPKIRAASDRDKIALAIEMDWAAEVYCQVNDYNHVDHGISEEALKQLSTGAGIHAFFQEKIAKFL